ncbi:MAG TPA: hypothetical protein VF163_20985 [Micromonosporaceae bacterium]
MRIYAERGPTALRQLLFDLLIVAWVAFWVRTATWVYQQVSTLAVPGQKIEGAGEGMAGGLADAGDKVGNVPAVGDELSVPFDRAAGAANALADAGRAQQDAVHQLAIVLVILILAVPLALVLLGWLPLRLSWIRRASVLASLRARPSGRDLLALRALTHQNARRLLRIHPEPAAAWRAGDPETIRTLAQLELRAAGLHPPASLAAVRAGGDDSGALRPAR